jgi:alpha-tubulin suppressor-like RCC1 family protein
MTDGGDGRRDLPTKVERKAHPLKQIVIGHLFGAALDEMGIVYGWGSNSSGQLAISPNYMFTDALEIAAGYATACARVRSGEIMCIGSNARGILGRDKFDAPQDSVAAPVILPTNRSAKKLAMSSDHACALLDDGTVWCWGANSYGGLGSGQSNGSSVDPPESSLPLKVQGLSNPAIAIAAGVGFSCALLSDHTVMCWGLNREGTLGQGVLDETPHISPVRVPL